MCTDVKFSHYSLLLQKELCSPFVSKRSSFRNSNFVSNITLKFFVHRWEMYVCACLCVYVCTYLCVFVYMYVLVCNVYCLFVCAYIWCVDRQRQRQRRYHKKA